MGVPDQVGTLVPAKRMGVVAGGDAQREAVLERGHTGDLPAAEDGIFHPTHMRAEAFALAHRQLVDVAQHQALRDVVRVERFFRRSVVEVANLRGGKLRPRLIALRIVEVLGNRERGEELQTLAPAMRKVELHGVVHREGRRCLRILHAAELREGP